ncbi:MAG: stage II sporulation protein M, partial [Actinobacteria bacterium]|nr:stage II sporulation protein M [Actinomycetota bacterium]
MDIDRFLVVNGPVWDRLARLTRAGRRAGRLSGSETDELVALYQRVSTHLSYARTSFNDPGLVLRLSQLVAGAGAVVYGSRPRTWRAVGRFFTATFPAALWRVRVFLAVSAALTFAPAVGVGVWLAHSHAALDAAAPPALRAAYVDEESLHYYTDEPSAAFATKVFTNNVAVAIFAFAAGILVCVPTAVILLQNGANLGMAAGLFAAAGKLPLLFGLLLPHGLIELTSVVIAGAAGLRLGWTVVDSGDRLRRDALAEEGRRAVVLVMGVACTLLVAGAIEGFVTGSALPTVVRVGIGVAVEVAFVLYAFLLGRQAAGAGLTGSLDEEDRGWARPPTTHPGGTAEG